MGLPDKFIFYPAKFWPHKNHINLIKALAFLKNKGININLVLTGSKDADFSSFKKVFASVKQFGLDKQVFYKGYVSNKEISAIYKTAKALVMPTYFGPTNIPVLEAWTMGTPVIYSDIRGCNEQLGTAGLLVNPNNPSDIADKILKIYTQPGLASELVKKGRIRVKEWAFSDFAKKVANIIDEYKKILEKTNKNRFVFGQ
jgi:glycosyltransferase involved in cell wall biosynthesis